MLGGATAATNNGSDPVWGLVELLKEVHAFIVGQSTGIVTDFFAWFRLPDSFVIVVEVEERRIIELLVLQVLVWLFVNRSIIYKAADNSISQPAGCLLSSVSERLAVYLALQPHVHNGNAQDTVIIICELRVVNGCGFGVGLPTSP